MTENEIARIAVDAAYQVHTGLGPGLLESLKLRVSTKSSRNRQISGGSGVTAALRNGQNSGEFFYAQVILEIKSVESVARVHKKQLLTYLRLADKRLGLVINFGSELIKDGISRVVNGLTE